MQRQVTKRDDINFRKTKAIKLGIKQRFGRTKKVDIGNKTKTTVQGSMLTVKWKKKTKRVHLCSDRYATVHLRNYHLKVALFLVIQKCFRL